MGVGRSKNSGSELGSGRCTACSVLRATDKTRRAPWHDCMRPAGVVANVRKSEILTRVVRRLFGRRPGETETFGLQTHPGPASARPGCVSKQASLQSQTFRHDNTFQRVEVTRNIPLVTRSPLARRRDAPPVQSALPQNTHPYCVVVVPPVPMSSLSSSARFPVARSRRSRLLLALVVPRVVHGQQLGRIVPRKCVTSQ